MTQELQKIFNYKENQVRTVIKDDEIWFVLTDVCKILDLSTPSRVKERLGDGVSSTHTIDDSLGRMQQTTVINEGGLYDVILESRKPEAKAFRKWVTSQVIPSIRKHGGYLTPEKLEEALLNPDTLIRLATDLKTEREKRVAAEQTIQLNQPKVIFADAVSASRTSILISDLAKLLKQNGYDTGQKRLFAELRDKGYLIKRKSSDYNSPTQRSMELGLFEVKETAITHADGRVTISKTTKVTGKGQLYFLNKFLREVG